MTDERHHPNDPNALLREIRGVLNKLTLGHPPDDPHPYSTGEMLVFSLTLAVSTRRLDDHISNGGDLPTAWNASHPPF